MSVEFLDDIEIKIPSLYSWNCKPTALKTKAYIKLTDDHKLDFCRAIKDRAQDNKTDRERAFSEAVKNTDGIIPMESTLWAIGGLSLEDARFVATQLNKHGFYLFKPEELEWQDIDAYEAELRKGQSIREDAGGYFLRCLKRLIGYKIPDEDVITYRKAAKALIDRIAEKD